MSQIPWIATRRCSSTPSIPVGDIFECYDMHTGTLRQLSHPGQGTPQDPPSSSSHTEHQSGVVEPFAFHGIVVGLTAVSGVTAWRLGHGWTTLSTWAGIGSHTTHDGMVHRIRSSDEAHHRVSHCDVLVVAGQVSDPFPNVVLLS